MAAAWLRVKHGLLLVAYITLAAALMSTEGAVAKSGGTSHVA